MNINPRLALINLIVALLLIAPFSIAAKEKKPPKIFSDATEMNVTLSGPWRKIKRNIKKDDLYPVQLTYTGADGQQHTIEAEVTPRGLTRRFKVCKFPPLKIHFDKEKMKGTEFRGNKSLKLVTYCQTHSKYEQYYVKEFLVYRIYNLITEYSFRAQPMMVEYKDSEKDDSITRFSFLIEDIDEVADRNDLKKLTVGRVPQSKLDALETSYLSLFQYLIGNLDWAATGGPDKDKCCHNGKIIGKSENENPKYTIPYDFDASGLVNAHYAVPPDGLKVRNIRQRLYRGFCVHNDKLPQAVARFNEKKPDIMALFEDNTHLTKKTRNNTIDYIEDFYEVLNDPKRFKREITDKCRG
jgi:hypothetical protein